MRRTLIYRRNVDHTICEQSLRASTGLRGLKVFGSLKFPRKLNKVTAFDSEGPRAMAFRGSEAFDGNVEPAYAVLVLEGDPNQVEILAAYPEAELLPLVGARAPSIDTTLDDQVNAASELESRARTLTNRLKAG